MNIKQAKEQIENAMKAYFTKDSFGNYIIPIERQRPIFLMGPPGIGKTAIMEQVASRGLLRKHPCRFSMDGERVSKVEEKISRKEGRENE